MSIFNRIITNIWHDLWPVVKGAEEIAEDVGKHVKEAIENVKEAADDLVSVVTDSPAAIAMQVDILNRAAALRKDDTGEDLTDWPSSVVDLCKLVHIDPSKANRRELAAELKISGYDFSGPMNVELSKRILERLRKGKL